MYESWRDTRGGASTATHEYWPPATGQREQSSAITSATNVVNTQTPIQPYMMTGGPPAPTPMMKTPPSAVQLFRKSDLVYRDI